jgi:hypothetical protein
LTCFFPYIKVRNLKGFNHANRNPHIQRPDHHPCRSSK